MAVALILYVGWVQKLIANNDLKSHPVGIILDGWVEHQVETYFRTSETVVLKLATELPLGTSDAL